MFEFEEKRFYLKYVKANDWKKTKQLVLKKPTKTRKNQFFVIPFC